MNKSFTKRSKKEKSKSGVVLQSSDKSIASTPLQEKCKKNYRNSYKKYNNFFLKCVEEIEALQPSGFACIQASRYFTSGVLPKYCTIPDPLTKKQRERVERLLAE